MDESLKQVGAYKRKIVQQMYNRAKTLAEDGKYLESWGVIDSALARTQQYFIPGQSELVEQLTDLKSQLPKIF